MAPSIRASQKRLFKHYIRNCRRKNVFWELSIEQFAAITTSNCSYCKRPPAQRSRTYIYNGIDRKNPKLGYFTDNVTPCCKECNGVKGDRLTYDEMLVVGEALTAFRKTRTGAG